MTALAASTAPTFAETIIKRPPAPSTELNTLLMHATFLVNGPAKAVPGKFATGTVSSSESPHKDEPKVANIVLVTAAHVLEDIDGDKATLLLRRRIDDGSYVHYRTSSLSATMGDRFTLDTRPPMLLQCTPTCRINSNHQLSPDALVNDKIPKI